ncbi:MAG TPA: hypothetical protein QGF02_00065 [Candidatus Babeliales bacterium]|nr:hypothetical protein [Candidatus Babeliales bacterium]
MKFSFNSLFIFAFFFIPQISFCDGVPEALYVVHKLPKGFAQELKRAALDMQRKHLGSGSSSSSESSSEGERLSPKLRNVEFKLEGKNSTLLEKEFFKEKDLREFQSPDSFEGLFPKGSPKSNIVRRPSLHELILRNQFDKLSSEES